MFKCLKILIIFMFVLLFLISLKRFQDPWPKESEWLIGVVKGRGVDWTPTFIVWNLWDICSSIGFSLAWQRIVIPAGYYRTIMQNELSNFCCSARLKLTVKITITKSQTYKSGINKFINSRTHSRSHRSIICRPNQS